MRIRNRCDLKEGITVEVLGGGRRVLENEYKGFQTVRVRLTEDVVIVEDI